MTDLILVLLTSSGFMALGLVSRCVERRKG